MRVLSLLLSLIAMLATPALGAECTLLGTDVCVRGADAACECPALAPVTNTNADFAQCLRFCCGSPDCAGATPIKTETCNCTCAGGIPHQFGDGILCE